MDTIQIFITWYITHPVQSFFLTFAEYVILFETWAYAKGTVFEKPVKYVGVLIFIPQDWLMNWMMMALFMDAPATWNEVVTKRMKRYKQTYLYSSYYRYNFWQRWRLNFAYWLCKHLNKHDHTGVHC